MAKNSIRDYSATVGENTDIQSVNIDEGCSPAGINNAIREMMVDLANVNSGAVSLLSPSVDEITVTGDITVNGDMAVDGTVDGRDVATDGTKLDGIEELADVTDTENVTAAGALMTSDITDLDAVKSINQDLTTTSDVVFNTLNTFSPADFLRVVASDLSNNGYVELGNGLIIQWGRETLTSGGGQTITWPTPFSTAPFIAFGVEVSDQNASSNISFGTQGAASWTNIDTASGGVYHWIAIGV